MKKIISLFLVVVIVTITTIPVMATNELVYNYSINGQDFIIEEVGSKTTITCYENDIIVDRVTVTEGKDEIVYEDFRSANLVAQEIKVSDHVDPEASIMLAPKAAPGYTALTGNIGSVKYKTSDPNEVYKTLTFSSKLTERTKITKTFYPGVGATVTLIAGLILNHLTGGAATLVIDLATIIVARAGVQMTGWSFTLDGEAFYYEVTGKASDTRTTTLDGAVYSGKLVVDSEGQVDQYQNVYSDSYPEFIERGDTAVAMGFYNYFWEGAANVNQFNPK